MNLPPTAIILAGGLSWSPQAVPLGVWQAHLLKHPLGVGALRREGSTARWNTEGWDTLDPPVIDDERRTRVVGQIVGLGDAKQRCEVRELRGRRSQGDRLECEACQPPVLNQCAKLLSEDGTSSRYAAVTAEVVAAVSNGVSMPRRELTTRLFALLGQPKIWDGLAVMSVGRERSAPLVRITRGDGVRVELYIGDGGSLRWRTTYRRDTTSREKDRWSFVLDPPAPDPRISLSDVYVIPRDWFIRHGS